MRTKTLFLCRGLPGSGKSSLARLLAGEHAYAADDYFELNGGYDFDREKIKDAHGWCQERVEADLKAGEPFVAVHNTFTRRWEANFYFDLAAKHNYSVFTVESQNDFGNIHGVPESAIEGMRDRWQPLIGDPLPLRRVIRNRWMEAKGRVKGRYYRWRNG